jgi:hypothetical protein
MLGFRRLGLIQVSCLEKDKFIHASLDSVIAAEAKEKRAKNNKIILIVLITIFILFLYYIVFCPQLSISLGFNIYRDSLFYFV